MMRVLKKHTVSLGHAFEGLRWAYDTQPNFKIHLLFSLISLLLSFYFQLYYAEWLLVLVVIIMGLVIELVNTAIEEATDAIDTNWREDIKIAKDVAAAAMLIYAIGALIIAIIIFVPKIILRFGF